MLHVARPLAARAVDVGLALAIELLHREGRTPAGGEGATQQLEPQTMLLRRAFAAGGREALAMEQFDAPSARPTSTARAASGLATCST